MILDTTAIIDLIDGLPEVVTKVEELQEREENLFITTPTIFELWTGIVQSDRPEQEKRKVLAITESQLILELDKKSAEEAGIINGTLQNEGQIIDPEDCMIAGIAKRYDEVILTRNIKHFKRIKGVSSESY